MISFRLDKILLVLSVFILVLWSVPARGGWLDDIKKQPNSWRRSGRKP